MSAKINLSRNTRLWVSTVTEGHNNSNTFEIPIQDGYTLNQNTSHSDVEVEEAGETPVRGSRRFNDSLDPVEWSFDTYITPYKHSSGKTYLVDMLMWKGLSAPNNSEVDFSDTSSEVYGEDGSLKVGFENNSTHVLKKLYMYFKIDNTVYLVEGAQVGSAEISGDITDIAQVSWSGEAIEYNAIDTPAFVDSPGHEYDNETTETDTFVKIPQNKRYIINKMTVMDLNADVAPTSDDNYDIPITGGSITIENNITYLTPETLAEVDRAVGSYTGTFSVEGNVEAYLRDRNGDGTEASPYGSAELLSHMLTAVSDQDRGVTNAANLVLHLGGKQQGEPAAEITIPSGHLAVPEFDASDIVSSSMDIRGVTTNESMESGDEVFLDFYAERP